MNRLLRSAATAFACGCLLAACAPSQSRPPAPHPKASSSNDQTQNLAVTGQGGTMDLPDPNHPGWMLWQLSFRSVIAVLKAQTVKAHDVTAILYHDGVRDAQITAPTATGDTGSGTIIATGGVHYISLTQPGTYMRADSVLWNARTQRGMARGNVHYHSGKNGLMMDLPKLYFNSGLRVVQSDPFGP